MVIASTVTSQQSIQDSRFKTAGWFSIFGGILIYPALIIAFLAMSQNTLKPLLFIEIPLTVVGVVLGTYILTQFKRLLNERFDIHNLNTIITALIVSNIVVGVKDIIVTIIIVMSPNADFASSLDAILGISGLLLIGIIGIILGVCLLRIHDESYGLLRIYAIILIIASSCLVSIILFPIGILLHLSNGVILGIIFLKAAETDVQVEFV